jgi:class 3 adenylate cyclase
VTRRDKVTRKRPAAGAELEHQALPFPNRLEQGQNARRAGVGMEPVPSLVHEGEIAPVVRPSGDGGTLRGSISPCKVRAVGNLFESPLGESYTRSMGATRKIVTIVFSDVSGSTRLGEELDAEALRQVMERYFEEMRSILERHGGTVEKFIGDAVMAAFGIPVAHEDDALRAVRAAADMRGRLAVLNEEWAGERGVTLAVRTGVNTGEVVVGDPAEGHFYASGDAVNVAARLEQAAEPGEILLGETTYRLVRDAVAVDALGSLALKGKSDAVGAYRLRELIEGAPALARRFDTPFVGREQELAHLVECFECASGERTPVLVTVLGPAGIGKTRLAAEFTAEVQERATVLEGRCLSYGERDHVLAARRDRQKAPRVARWCPRSRAGGDDRGDLLRLPEAL